jgi:lipopolysaccharide transport system permease protein
MPAVPRIDIEPPRGWSMPSLSELWQYRDVLYFLAWRDIRVRYRQTLLGIAWAVLQPVMLMLVFSLFLGKLAQVPSDGIAYPLFVLAGLVPWTLFAQSLGEVSHSLVANERLLTKVWFPRLALPLSAIGAPLVDFAFAAIVLGVLLALQGIAPRIEMLAIPFLVVLAPAAALSVGLWLAALNVRYRDVRYTLAFLIQFWMFATPVVYPASLLPEAWRAAYALNPMVGVVEGFRWALFPGTASPAGPIAISVTVVAVLLVGGLLFFNRMEASFADEV